MSENKKTAAAMKALQNTAKAAFEEAEIQATALVENIRKAAASGDIAAVVSLKQQRFQAQHQRSVKEVAAVQAEAEADYAAAQEADATVPALRVVFETAEKALKEAQEAHDTALRAYQLAMSEEARLRYRADRLVEKAAELQAQEAARLVALADIAAL